LARSVTDVVSQASPTPVPVTILTGFLGSGKTTLLRRVLQEHHDRRIAVIENEFGEVGIDDRLLRDAGTGAEIVELSNGCVCCSVRGNLVHMLEALHAKRQAGALDFERVVIETTGLADPGPVAHTLARHGPLDGHYRLDAIVTVVDAKHGQRQLDDFPEAQAQVGFADRLLISKTDLVGADDEARLRQRLARMNPRAPIARVHFGETPIADLLDIGGSDSFGVPDDVHASHVADDLYARHARDDSVGSFVFRAARPFDCARLDEFLSAMIDVYGNDMLRYKGLVDLNGHAGRVIVQGVQTLFDIEPGPRRAAGEMQGSVLVFIGRDLPRDLFLRGLSRCLVAEPAVEPAPRAA
jgi:G3E family GTPase